MFVYESDEPIDYFSGMTKLKDYINLCYKNKNDPCSYMTYLELNKFLISSFMAVKCTVNHWEGDIRSDDIFISAIPIGDNCTAKIIAFKQDNNGASFIASEFSLPKSDHLKQAKIHDLTSECLMDYFDESFSLTMELLDKATKETNPIINATVVSMYELKEAVEKHNKKDETSNKFDIKNYQKL